MMKNFQKSMPKLVSGFTILETLIAVAILVAGIIGTTSAVQTGISSYIFSKDQIIAFYLAQEGFEQIRNTRDENALKQQPWLTGIADSSDDPCYFGNTCYVDPFFASEIFTRCIGGPGSCPMLRQHTAGSFGYNSAWTPSIFRRELRLTRINANEISILVTVNWSKGTVSRQFRGRGNILNWQ